MCKMLELKRCKLKVQKAEMYNLKVKMLTLLQNTSQKLKKLNVSKNIKEAKH